MNQSILTWVCLTIMVLSFPGVDDGTTNQGAQTSLLSMQLLLDGEFLNERRLTITYMILEEAIGHSMKSRTCKCYISLFQHARTKVRENPEAFVQYVNYAAGQDVVHAASSLHPTQAMFHYTAVNRHHVKHDSL